MSSSRCRTSRSSSSKRIARACFPIRPSYLANDRRNASFGPNSTGLIQERKFTGTVALIEKLQPDARNVFVIAGAAAGDKARGCDAFADAVVQLQTEGELPLRACDRRARAATRPDCPNARRTICASPRTAPETVLTRLNTSTASRPRRTRRPIAGSTRRWIMGSSAAASTASWRRFAGQVNSPCGARRRKGREHRHVSHRSEPDQIDWRQLRRWGIDEARVPAGTIVRFRDPSIWDRYKRYILALSPCSSCSQGSLPRCSFNGENCAEARVVSA